MLDAHWTHRVRSNSWPPPRFEEAFTRQFHAQERNSSQSKSSFFETLTRVCSSFPFRREFSSRRHGFPPVREERSPELMANQAPQCVLAVLMNFSGGSGCFCWANAQFLIRPVAICLQNAFNRQLLQVARQMKPRTSAGSSEKAQWSTWKNLFSLPT